MYKAKIFGKVVKLTDKDFKQIVRKYDIENAVMHETFLTEMKINIRCSLCDKFADKDFCAGCPFSKFLSSHRSGCVKAAELIVGRPIKLNHEVTYLDTPRQVVGVEKIHRFLLKRFKKVSKYRY